MPIQLGARVTGKVGKFGVGLLNIQGDEESVSATPSTNFTVLRVKRDVLKNGAIGAMFTSRSNSNVAAGANHAYGVDAAFGFFQNVTVGAYYARTDDRGRDRRRPTAIRAASTTSPIATAPRSST